MITEAEAQKLGLRYFDGPLEHDYEYAIVQRLNDDVRIIALVESPEAAAREVCRPEKKTALEIISQLQRDKYYSGNVYHVVPVSAVTAVIHLKP